MSHRYWHLIFSINGVLTFVIQFCKNRRNLMTALKITSVANSAGVLLPKEIWPKLRVDKGDVLNVIETENGIQLTPYDPEFDAQMAVAEYIMREDRDILRKLAKLQSRFGSICASSRPITILIRNRMWLH